MRPATTLLLVLLLAIYAPAAQACKAKNRFIEFGSGGGFTGKYKEYKLDENGTLYLKKDSTHFDKIKTVDKKQTAAFFKDIAALTPSDWAVNDPGNMSYYIRCVDSHDRRIATWNDITKLPSDTLRNLYRKLVSTIAN